ncbi:hypothetical protein PAPHI01_0094 [Pancytospora philotis]|nr:hypothetical protein PAPHI01_0094 [Pancytospora philotis]
MIPILYGSQTGAAIHLSGMLAAELGPAARVLPMDAFNVERLADAELVIFVCSTHGDGQCPFNMVKFWTMIMADIPACFSFRYAVLGLGDSSYQKYNWCARMLYNRLEQLGAVPVLRELANVQDPGGMYDGYRRFARAIGEHVGQNAPTGPLSGNSPAVDGQEAELSTRTRQYEATVASNTVVTAADYAREIREIVLSIPHYTDFYPGDCIGIRPVNSPDALDGYPFTRTESEYILQNIDLNCTPRQPVFAELALLAHTPLYRDKLREIARDYDAYHAYAVIPRRNILEVLQDFGIEPSYEFMAALERIYPRYYSCSRVAGGYSILASMVDYRTQLKAPRRGLCSEYLRGLSGSLAVEVVQSRLFMDDKNLLFFATGSGITLPRSAALFFKDKNIRVYYGFRSHGRDQLCMDDLRGCDVHLAASVDDGRYFMDAYRAAPVENIDDWLVFASGNTRINKEIHQLIQEVHGKPAVFQSETW